MIGIIVAYDRNNVIGNNGKIPWSIKGEQKRFKELTKDNVVIMGRRTYDEIGHPLPDRFNIVVTSKLIIPCYDENSICIPARSIENAMHLATIFTNMDGARNIFLIGGSSIYQAGMDIADVIYATEIDAEFTGDTYFPKIDETKFTREVESYHDDAEYPYYYTTYTRNK